MYFDDFLRAVFASGECAMQAARRAYVANLGELAREGEDIEGGVTGLSAAPLDAFMPSDMNVRVGVRLFEGGDGRLEVGLDDGRRDGLGLLGRRSGGSRGEVTVRWSAVSPPEGICRVRDVRDDKIVFELKRLED